VAGLAAKLSDTHDITLICPESERRDAWARAHAEVRDLAWLEWNAARLDAILYATDRRPSDAFAELMARRPGLLLLLDDGGVSQAARPSERDLYAWGGLGALADAAAGRIDAKAVAALAGEALVRSARLTLREGEGGLPLLPLLVSERAGAALRAEMGVPADAALAVAIVADEAAGAELARLFRFADVPNAHLLICASAGDDAFELPEGAVHLAGNVHRARVPLKDCYRGLLSAADLLLVPADVDAGLRARLEADAGAMRLQALFEADRVDGLAERLAPLLTSRTGADVRPRPVALSVADPSLTAWAERIDAAVAHLRSQPPTQLAAVGAALGSTVRGTAADADDLAQLADALTANTAIERAPTCFVDLTAYAAGGRRLDPAATAHLRALFRRGGARISGIIHDGTGFVVADRIVGQLLGLRDADLQDRPLLLRSGDRVVGLDLLDSFQPASFDALQAAHDRGASLLYLVTGQVSLEGGREEALADLALTWAETAEGTTRRTIASLSAAQPAGPADPRLTGLMDGATKQSLPLQILTVDPLPAKSDFDTIDASSAVQTAWAELSAAPRASGPGLAPDTGFAVMGHLIGSYSLAIINRNVARALENWRPGHVRFLAYETVPIAHTDRVPASEKALMAELCARPAPRADEIVISQHWPIMPPRDHHGLALSLFPWEESHVPDSLIATLNNGFDAIIAPSRAVADALTLSGIRLPVAAIGQPVELEPFQALAADRPSRRPIRRFLHLSSCFERKGIDLLLAAWARAFTDRDGVELVIKTFPNPHNRIEERVAALREKHPRLGRIEIVNRDVERDEMPAFYAAADAMVLPSRGEGYNLPALEAMAAGLPLIVTGHGGHRDFCGPDQARLLRYRFTPSGSHVAGDNALWAEPDLDDLVEALREYADPANADLIEARRQSALAAAAAEGDRAAWIRRFQGTASDLLAVTDQSAPRIGWISTWRVTCGIAQYSAHLIDRMSPAVRQRMKVICDHRTTSDQGEIAHLSSWKVMEGDAGDIVTGVRESDVEAVVIQHQDGLVPWEQLGLLGHDRALDGLVTVAMLHNVRTLSWKVSPEDLPTVVSGLARMTRLLVHTREDLNLLLELGLDRNVGLFPHGAVAPGQSRWPRRLRAGDAPVIGCHGFFLRHKGIDKLIRAAAILRREWPDLKLRLVNARFPNPEHEGAVGECMELARELGIEDAIEWHLDFLPVDRIEALLAGCDLIVLPYDDSDDSVSGAVRTALASMVPLVATRVKIFGDLGAAVGWADSNDPDVLADTIAPILRSPEKRREIQAGMHAWLTAHDWQRMATTLENMIHGLVRQKRLGWLLPSDGKA
jgi:glycosyltransferase involved in cell wall biosynthesis